ncbi:hypothetical protein GA0074692_6759 [Micromonospora pallida]|uniref:Uncharacterized protein n=1 Tax=Micromonospora pallida TaxID=145854 RepID=A0A1C6TN58_9ACTN|nr:hypothetical protein [Micromonospora pallida]SCL43196.1 hypothetical protein GA0074692_6759 [Micromonospora pallida]
MTHDELLTALLVERYGPPPLPPAAPPHQVDQALAVPAAPPPTADGRPLPYGRHRRRHLVLLDGGAEAAA